MTAAVPASNTFSTTPVGWGATSSATRSTAERDRHQTVVLDRAVSGEDELFARLEEVLSAKVHTATVQELDLVNDKTTVEVRYSCLPARGGARRLGSASTAGYLSPAPQKLPLPQELPASQELPEPAGVA
jgi:hypothetical protein